MPGGRTSAVSPSPAKTTCDRVARTRSLLTLMTLFMASCAALARPAGAAALAGPSVALDRTEVQPGQRVSVTLSGWRSTSVNLSVCGNLARRGSADCNVAASQEVRLANGSNVTLTYLVVFAPPTSCPCVVRAASQGQEELVLLPVELIGIPVGPVVGPDIRDPISVSVEARAADRGALGALRAALGGPVLYRVKVSLRNASSEPVSDVSLEGAAGRGGSDTAVSFDLPSPGTIAPGQTWEHELEVITPSLMLAGAAWRVTASGAGAPAVATTVTSRVPIGLFLLGALLAVDIAVMAWRMTVGRQRRRLTSPPTLARAPDLAQDPLKVREPFRDGAVPDLPTPVVAGDQPRVGQHLGVVWH